jgi:hypothetical protein
VRYGQTTLALYSDLFEGALSAVKEAAHSTVKEALSPNARTALIAALGGGAGLGLGAGGGYLAGKSQGDEEAEKERLRTRNISFGTGLAAGVAAPHLIRGLGQIARGASGTGLFPEFQTIGQY